MRFEDGLVGDLLAVGQAVEAVEIGGIAKLVGQGATGVLEDQSGRLGQPPGPADVSKPDSPEIEPTKGFGWPKESGIGVGIHHGLRPKRFLVLQLRHAQ
jgi:hypothetical protein